MAVSNLIIFSCWSCWSGTSWQSIAITFLTQYWALVIGGVSYANVSDETHRLKARSVHKDWESVRHEADLIAVQMWKQLGSGPSLDRTQRIHPGQKSKRLGILGRLFELLVDAAWCTSIRSGQRSATMLFPRRTAISCRIAHLLQWVWRVQSRNWKPSMKMNGWDLTSLSALN